MINQCLFFLDMGCKGITLNITLKKFELEIGLVIWLQVRIKIAKKSTSLVH